MDGEEKAFKFVKDNKLALDEFGDLSKNIMFAIQNPKHTTIAKSHLMMKLINLAKNMLCVNLNS